MFLNRFRRLHCLTQQHIINASPIHIDNFKVQGSPYSCKNGWLKTGTVLTRNRRNLLIGGTKDGEPLFCQAWAEGAILASYQSDQSTEGMQGVASKSNEGLNESQAEAIRLVSVNHRPDEPAR
jgi:hypothetical protein